MPLMACFILNRGPIYCRGFSIRAQVTPRSGWLGSLLDRIDTNVEATISFKNAPTTDQLLAVHSVVGKYFGHKKTSFDGQTVRLKMARSEFCHPRNRHFLKKIITDALSDERPHGLRVA